MKNNDKKLIYVLLIIITLSSIILIIKIKTTDEYNKELYDEIYSEYEQITERKVEESINNNEKTYLYSNSQGTTMRVIGEISIPKINISYPIIFETTDEYLKIAPTKFCGPKINTVGNLCIIGHNYKNYKFFSNLEKLENGDKVFISDAEGQSLTYYVYDKYIINETDLSCTNQNTDGRIELTLITCNKNKQERLVIKCESI